MVHIQEQHRGCFGGHRGHTGVQNRLDNFMEVKALRDFGTHCQVSVEVGDLPVVRQPVKKLADNISQQGGNLPHENLPGQPVRRRQDQTEKTQRLRLAPQREQDQMGRFLGG